MKQYLKEKISDNQLDLKTAIILNKAIRTFKPYEAKAAKEHGLTPTQFSVLETLYSKGELRIQDLIEKNVSHFWKHDCRHSKYGSRWVDF